MDHEKTKHISRKVHFIRDIAQGDASVKTLCTSRNLGHIVTKLVPVKKYKEAVNLLGMAESMVSSGEA